MQHYFISPARFNKALASGTVPINYNRKVETYYYTTSFDLLVNVSVQVLLADEVRNIYAGQTILTENFFTARLMQ